MSVTMRAPRSRGMISGFLLVLLGLWGGLVPFVGPYAHFAYTPDQAWTMNSGRLWLQVLPAIATVLGGLILLTGANRVLAIAGAWIAALGGAWFAVGGPISTRWTADGANAAGSPVGGATRQLIEQLTFFTGLGVVIVFLAALALGRFTVIGLREARIAEAEEAAAAAPPEPATEPLPRRQRPYDQQPPAEQTGPTTPGPGPGPAQDRPYGTSAPGSDQAVPPGHPWQGRYAGEAPKPNRPAEGDVPVAGSPSTRSERR